MPYTRSPWPFAAISALPAALLSFGCSTGGSTASPAPVSGSGGSGESTPAASAGASACAEPPTEEPSWFAACDIGESQGSCTSLDDSGTYCVEIRATTEPIDIAGTCGAERVRCEKRCPTEGAVLICVSPASRQIYYDQATADAVRLGCTSPCAPTALPGCDEYLTCLCGSAQPQTDDSDNCKQVRSLIAQQRSVNGEQGAQNYCARLFAATPECAKSAGSAGAGG